MRKRKKKQRPKWNSKLGNFFCFFQKSTNKQVKWINKNGGDSPAFSAMHHVIVSETSTTDEITLKVLFLFWRWSIGQWLGGCMDCQDRRGSVASCTEFPPKIHPIATRDLKCLLLTNRLLMEESHELSNVCLGEIFKSRTSSWWNPTPSIKWAAWLVNVRLWTPVALQRVGS